MQSKDDTRSKILDVAAVEFSRRGFEGASLREICKEAGVVVSAVKYHFGGKEKLYEEVWRVASVHMQSVEPMPTLDDGDDPETTLRQFMAWFMRLVIVQGQEREWTGNLLSQEMLQPTTTAFQPFVEECCKPVRDEFQRLVHAISREGVGPRKTEHIVYALIAMCTNSKHYGQIYSALGYEVPTTVQGVNRLAATLAELAIGGIRSFRETEAG